jgi:DNA-directed RNA polymerase
MGHVSSVTLLHLARLRRGFRPPDFVHALDAAHLLRTFNAAVSEGITSIATVHDCFGCLPSRAERFREIIREEFVRMCEEHDVLAEVLAQARKDLGAVTKGLPDKAATERLFGHQAGSRRRLRVRVNCNEAIRCYLDLMLPAS